MTTLTIPTTSIPAMISTAPTGVYGWLRRTGNTIAHHAKTVITKGRAAATRAATDAVTGSLRKHASMIAAITFAVFAALLIVFKLLVSR